MGVFSRSVPLSCPKGKEARYSPILRVDFKSSSKCSDLTEYCLSVSRQIPSYLKNDCDVKDILKDDFKPSCLKKRFNFLLNAYKNLEEKEKLCLASTESLSARLLSSTGDFYFNHYKQIMSIAAHTVVFGLKHLPATKSVIELLGDEYAQKLVLSYTKYKDCANKITENDKSPHLKYAKCTYGLVQYIMDSTADEISGRVCGALFAGDDNGKALVLEGQREQEQNQKGGDNLRRH